jgi:multidrug efflux pump subunit AcrA (membrane-fusion protein)
LAACSGLHAREDAGGADHDPVAAPSLVAADPDAVIGFVVAREFTELRAPRNVFKLAGWHSVSGHTKLTKLAEEGRRVTKDEVVARFHFRHARALDRVKDRIRRAEAEAKESAIAEEKRLSELLAERRRRVLAAAAARLDTLKEAVISRRQLQLFQIAETQARFEVEAITARVAAQRKTLNAERAYHARKVARERANIARYRRQKARYSLRAPHAGVVRHAYFRHFRRKVKKGDGMPAGLPVVLLARDERLSVRCFVPEHRLDEIHIGQSVTVSVGGSTTKYNGEVTRIERFPQELGFLLGNDELPNARAKAFVVVADLGARSGLAAGNEVRVRLSRGNARRGAGR